MNWDNEAKGLNYLAKENPDERGHEHAFIRARSLKWDDGPKRSFVAHCESLFTKRRFTVEMNRPKLGVLGFLAVQLIAAAMLLVGPITVKPDED